MEAVICSEGARRYKISRYTARSIRLTDIEAERHLGGIYESY